MAVKLRLTRMGSKKRAFFRLVATNSGTRRDGRPLAFLGWYNPHTKPAQVQMDMEQVKAWLDRGAQASDTVRALIRQAEKPAA
ncbi:MAG: 30S ribosomal protein S16 [Deltaproteobacteria bacterium]|nr:30S ribosomal protein S16 [Deltaproteobacteria bacterium]